jgi:hypothetical protein
MNRKFIMPPSAGCAKSGGPIKGEEIILPDSSSNRNIYQTLKNILL